MSVQKQIYLFNTHTQRERDPSHQQQKQNYFFKVNLSIAVAFAANVIADTVKTHVRRNKCKEIDTEWKKEKRQKKERRNEKICWIIQFYTH